MSYQPDIVIYHDKCMDGFTAAWAVWKRFGDAPEYVARNYGMAPDIDCRGKHVLIVDFWFPGDVLKALAREGGAASVIILDHHKTAQADLADWVIDDVAGEFWAGDDPLKLVWQNDERLGAPIAALFDMERSGAGMAWDFCHDGERPMLVNLVEDRDLWRFALGDASKLLHLALASGPATFERWEEAEADIDGFVSSGQVIAAYRDQLVDEIVQRAAAVWIDGQYGIGVDCPYALASDVCHRLLEDWPFAEFAAAIVRGERTITYSLRSVEDRIDVSAIAKKFGGGGHRNAAGFKVPRGG